MAEQRFQLREREGKGRKCLWCHEVISDTEARGSIWTCKEDGTVCHKDCARQFGKCPQCSRPVEERIRKGDLARQICSPELRRFEPGEAISNADAIRAMYPNSTIRELILKSDALLPGVHYFWLFTFLAPLILIIVAQRFLGFEYPGIEYLFHPTLAWAAIARFIAGPLRVALEPSLREWRRALARAVGGASRGRFEDSQDESQSIHILFDYEDASRDLKKWVESPVESRDPQEGQRLVNHVLDLKEEIERRFGVNRQDTRRQGSA